MFNVETFNDYWNLSFNDEHVGTFFELDSFYKCIKEINESLDKCLEMAKLKT